MSLRRCFLLTRLLFKVGAGSEISFFSGSRRSLLKRIGRGQGERSRLQNLLLILALSAYFAWMIFSLCKGIVGGLLSLGQGAVFPPAALHVVNLFMLLQGFFLVSSTLFFSKLRERLLAFPLRISEILGAYGSYLYSIFLFYVLSLGLPALATYGWLSGQAWGFYGKSFLALLVLPLLPLSLMIILSILVMSLTPLAKNKDRFMNIAQIAMMVLALGLMFVLMKAQGQGRISENGLDPALLANGQMAAFARTLNLLFPSLPLLGRFLNTGGLTALRYLLLALGISLLYLAAALAVGNLLFSRGFRSAGEGGSKRRRLSEAALERALTPRSPFISLLKLEWRRILRSPVMLVNNVLGSFLPLLIMAFVSISSYEKEGRLLPLEQFRSTAAALWAEGGTTRWLLLIGTAAVAAAFGYFYAGMGSLNSTAFSREGQEICRMKEIPLSYKRQIGAKTLLSWLLSLPMLILATAALAFVFFPPWPLLLCFLLFLFLSSAGAQYPGLFLDARRPLLSWENETQAVKQNRNVIFSMLFTMAIAGLFAALLALALKGKSWQLVLSGLSVLLLSLLLPLLFRFFALKEARRCLEHLEDYL